MRRTFRFFCLFQLLFQLFFSGCHKDARPQPEVPFKMHTAEYTGLNFSNDLTADTILNIFSYMYFYNGGGVAVADFNRDGNQDIYFAGNQTSNALYLGNGDLTFRNVTQISKATGESGWSTGVAVTDINQDGLPDIYVSQVSGYRNLTGHNRLYICQSVNAEGVPVYKEAAHEYGLDQAGFGTQSGFLDYDKDGDLDLFQVNHSVHKNGTFGQRKDFEGTFHPTAGDRLFKNENGKFIDVTAESGILGTVIGYGLGFAFSDINNDGWTDIYVTNDFHENDYLYINQQDGTFRESLTDMIRHTSRYSMGVDVADINNDGHCEIFTLDMHPEDPYILKSSLGDDDYGLFQFKLIYGYNHQYARNNLQLNNGDLSFSEIGTLSDVYASDWSWSALFFDYDHDGYKDLFISNGIPKRMNDIDYLNYTANNDIRWKIQMDEIEETDLEVENRIPEIKLINKFYRNNRNLTFNDVSTEVENTLPCYSNGAAYGDFDNDGDLDIVVNNIREKAYLYENLLNTSRDSDHHFISINLTGPASNLMAIGARILAFKPNEILSAEQYPWRGYLSSVSSVLHLGLGGTSSIDSIILIWPDDTYQKISMENLDKTIALTYQKGLPKYKFHAVSSTQNLYEDITSTSGIDFIHEENEFVEFNREQLIPHMTSAEGPALAVRDINGDGLEDFFVGGSKREKGAVYLQEKGGTFTVFTSDDILNDSIFEDVDAVFADIDNDGDPDLIVASGGNEYAGTSAPLLQRIYVNDGNGRFHRDTSALPDLYMTAGCVAACDYNLDGDIDLFFGGRAVPWNYGKIPASYLLHNKGNGKFLDVTLQLAPQLYEAGLVKDGSWEDMNNDALPDLIIAAEWSPIQIYYQEKDHTFRKHELSGTSGWWNFISTSDFDGDGDIDFLAGNLGLNSKLKATTDQPVHLYVGDFDANGQAEQIMTYFIDGKEIIFPTHREIMRQLPSLKKNYLLAKDFAKAHLSELIGKENMEKADKLMAEQFANSYFENIEHNGTFKFTPLPSSLQISSLKASVVADWNNDRLMDVMLAGNYFENNIELGRYDADYGSVLINSNQGITNGTIRRMKLDGQVRKIEQIVVQGVECYLIAKNNGPLTLIRIKSQ